jgi:3-hydroxyisobutyrate dehydrogenase-like beta-hydroxyacid dehydrogenase
MVHMSNRLSVAFIGFGEVGRTFSRDLLARGDVSAAAYDILFDDPSRAGPLHEAARDLGVKPAPSAVAAAAGADVVISAVTASDVMAVAEQAAGYLRAGQIFVDVNSASPNTKKAAAALINPSGAVYVEAAVMAPVKAPGLKVPILAGGPAASRVSDLLNAFGMNLTPVAEDYGRASAMKLCRSIMIKGIEALIVDASRAASAWGVEREVYQSLTETFPSIDWSALAANMAERVATHGVRRAAEMREAADMVNELGLNPELATAVADAQQRGARPK